MKKFVDYFGRINYLLSCLKGDESLSNTFQPISRVEKILYAKLTGGTYTEGYLSRLEKLFGIWCGFLDKSVIDSQPMSRSEEILYSKIFGTIYTKAPMSIAEELLLGLNGGGGGGDDDKLLAIVDLGQVDYAILGE